MDSTAEADRIVTLKLLETMDSGVARIACCVRHKLGCVCIVLRSAKFWGELFAYFGRPGSVLETNHAWYSL